MNLWSIIINKNILRISVKYVVEKINNIFFWHFFIDCRTFKNINELVWTCQSIKIPYL